MPAKTKRVDIVEVPHAAVGLTELDHGLELLGDGGPRLVRAQARPRRIEQARTVERRRRWLHGVADADVHLNAKTGGTEKRDKDDAPAAVVVVVTDGSDAESRQVEGQAVRSD
jgi:hypothetical protein